MAKASGGTRGGRSSSGSAPVAFGSGSGTMSSNNFDNMRASQFEGNSFVNGGSYELRTKDGKYAMTVDTEHGWNDQYGAEGTSYTISMVKGTDYVGGEVISRGFIESSSPYRGSGGYVNMGTNDELRETIDRLAPYLKERASRFIRNN